jgi:hypothetical protein
VDTDFMDALAKFIGFQPTSVSRPQDAAFAVQKGLAEHALKLNQVSDALAKAIVAGDQDEIDNVRDEIDSYNAKNPDLPLKPDPRGIRQRARNLMLTKEERLIKSAPKSLRGEIAARLRESQ